MTEIGFTFPPGTWVAQDRNGTWKWYEQEPEVMNCFEFWKLGVVTRTFWQQLEVNEYWPTTKHQIQPGETIWLEA